MMMRSLLLIVCLQVSCSTTDGAPQDSSTPQREASAPAEDLDRAKARTAEKMRRAADPTPRKTPSEDAEAVESAEEKDPEVAEKARSLSLLGKSSQSDEVAEDAMRRARARLSGEVMGPRDNVESFTEDEEQTVGEATVRAVLARFRVVPVNAPVSVYVRKVGAVLTENSSRPEVPYRFAVIESKSVNAFAAPYGYVFITTGALRFVENEAELALILAHEIAHVEKKHGMKQIARGYLDRGKRGARARMDALSTPLEGDAAERRDAMRKRMDELSNLILKGYGLPEELEADKVGLRMLSRAGYDPAAALACLARLAKLPRGGDEGHRLFRSHPKPRERYLSARSTAARLPSGGAVPRERFRKAVSSL